MNLAVLKFFASKNTRGKSVPPVRAPIVYLTTLTNGVAELIEDQKNGFLIPDPTRVDKIAEKIKTFFYDRRPGLHR